MEQHYKSNIRFQVLEARLVPLLATNPHGETHLEKLKKSHHAHRMEINGLMSVMATIDAPRSAVTEVFGISELVTLIFGFLHRARDMLNAQQVNVMFRNVIDSNRKFQQAMGLEPRESLHFWSPIWNNSFPPVKAQLDRSRGIGNRRWGQIRDNHAIFSIRVRGSIQASFCPTVGLRCRAMQVAQPPLFFMRVFIECSCTPGTRFRHCGPGRLDVETGITVGDILDAYSSALAQHENCRLVDSNCQTIEFERRIYLDDLVPDDPVRQRLSGVRP